MVGNKGDSKGKLIVPKKTEFHKKGTFREATRQNTQPRLA